MRLGFVGSWPVLSAAENADGFGRINIFLRQLQRRNIFPRISGRFADRHTLVDDVLQWMQCFKLSNPLQRLGSERVQLGSEAYL